MPTDSYSDIEISPGEVKARLLAGEQFLLVDVRERWEYDTAHIDGSTLIPLRELPEHIGRFQDTDKVILFCHHGIRSLDAAAWLRSQGVDGARSMAGGIERWSIEVDSKVLLY